MKQLSLKSFDLSGDMFQHQGQLHCRQPPDEFVATGDRNDKQWPIKVWSHVFISTKSSGYGKQAVRCWIKTWCVKKKLQNRWISGSLSFINGGKQAEPTKNRCMPACTHPATHALATCSCKQTCRNRPVYNLWVMRPYITSLVWNTIIQ